MDQRIADAIPTSYRIERELGSGGMATVYAARDIRHDRMVAIKVLRADLHPVTGPERFLREIRLAAQLTHPHILPLIDSGASNGVLFYVMPYIEGETLRDRLVHAGELSIQEAVRILRHVLDALEYAHARGIVHRDIKPENVLLSDRHALVADFGVARALDQSAGLMDTTSGATTFGVAVGTPAYMSPEQAAGDQVDHRADLYATGVVAFEMLTGRLPFQASRPQQMIAAHLTAVPDELLKWRPSAPARLAGAVMRCLEKRPSDRWQRAGDLLAEIESAVSHDSRSSGSAREANQLVEREFVLSERVCRKLNRATLDPRVIGDRLHYVDNQVESDIVVVFLHGLGLDHRDFGPILERLPYRGLSPTLYGCEPERRTRISLSLTDHVVILREWLKVVVERFHARTVAMVGFSLGADIGLELLMGPPDDSAPAIDAFLALECNLSLETCFVSRVLAGLTPDRPDALVAELKQFGDASASLDEWINIHEYLVKVLRKFQGDTGLLQRVAADIVRPLRDSPGLDVFARRFKVARRRVPALRLVFSGGSASRAALDQLKLENLDRDILGEEFPDALFTVMPKTDHFELMAADQVLRQVDELVGEARAAKRK
jgi:pimeloyl-ACP methyl ester carboxylesterase